MGTNRGACVVERGHGKPSCRGRELCSTRRALTRRRHAWNGRRRALAPQGDLPDPAPRVAAELLPRKAVAREVALTGGYVDDAAASEVHPAWPARWLRRLDALLHALPHGAPPMPARGLSRRRPPFPPAGDPLLEEAVPAARVCLRVEGVVESALPREQRLERAVTLRRLQERVVDDRNEGRILPRQLAFRRPRVELRKRRILCPGDGRAGSVTSG